MTNNQLLKQLQPEDLPFPLNKLAAAVGTETIFKLSKIVGGKRLYVPKQDALLNGIRKRLIIEEYEAGSITQAQLAAKYNISEKAAMRYISKANQKKQS
jgi:Mor family transcriptional regulator